MGTAISRLPAVRAAANTVPSSASARVATTRALARMSSAPPRAVATGSGGLGSTSTSCDRPMVSWPGRRTDVARVTGSGEDDTHAPKRAIEVHIKMYGFPN